MPTGSERDRQIAEATRRLNARRDAQQAHQGKGEPGESSPFRHSGLLDPRDPGGAGAPKHAIPVNVVGNDTLWNYLKALVKATGGQVPQHAGAPASVPVGMHANITSQGGVEGAGKDLTRELKMQADQAAQLVKLSTDHLSTMRKVYDQERNAVEELTMIVSNTLATIKQHQGNQQGSAAPGGSSPTSGGTNTPQGRPTPHGGAGGHTGPSTTPPARGGGGHGGGGGVHGGVNPMDPTGVLDPSRPVFGGHRSIQDAYMTHLQSGGHQGNFDPTRYMGGGRNHPTSFGELRRGLRVHAGRAIDQHFGMSAPQNQDLPTFQPEHDQHGNITHYNYDPKDGSGVEQVHPTDPRVKGLKAQDSNNAGKLRTAASATRMASSFATKGLGAALDEVPVVGWGLAAAEGVNQAAEWTTEQRASNAQYQAIEGGTNASTGISERWNKLSNRWGQRFSGGMTGDQSDQLFDSLTSQGFVGSQRQGYIDFASNNYKQMGVDPNQSAQLAATAANTMNSSLINMSESIKAVTSTAIQYGFSASEARQQLAANIQQLGSMGVQGGGGVALAAADTMQSMQGGRETQGINYTGLSNETNRRQQASHFGLTYGQYTASITDNPDLGAKGQDFTLHQAVGSTMGGATGAKATEIMNRYGGAQKVMANPSLMNTVTKELLKEDPSLDPSAMGEIMRAHGVTGVDTSNPIATTTAALQDYASGGTSMEQNAKKSEAQHGQRALNDDEKKALFDPRTGQAANPTYKTGPSGAFSYIGRMFGSEGWSGNPLNPSGTYSPFTGDTSDPQFLENQRELQTGQKDQTIDQLLDPSKGLAQDKKAGITVQTKQGPKVVSVQTAIKDYPDQVAKGDATIVGGPQGANGQSITQFTGGDEKSTYKGADTTGNDATPDAEDPGKWAQDHPDDTSQSGANGNNMTITVNPGPQLQNLLTFTGNGVRTAAGAAGGAPPAGTTNSLPDSSSPTPPG